MAPPHTRALAHSGRRVGTRTHLHARTLGSTGTARSRRMRSVCLFVCWRGFEFVLVAARLRPQELKLRVNATEALALYRKAVRPRIHRARAFVRYGGVRTAAAVARTALATQVNTMLGAIKQTAAAAATPAETQKRPAASKQRR
jgi:hypothetical protein